MGLMRKNGKLPFLRQLRLNLRSRTIPLTLIYAESTAEADKMMEPFVSGLGRLAQNIAVILRWPKKISGNLREISTMPFQSDC